MTNYDLRPVNQQEFPAGMFEAASDDAEYFDGGQYLGFVITPQGRYDLWSFYANAKAGSGYTGYFGVGEVGDFISGEIQTGQGCHHAHPGEDLPNLTNSVQDPMYGSGLAVNMAKGTEETYEEFAPGSEADVVTLVLTRAEADAYAEWRMSR